VPHGTPGGTSVFNFSPQGGGGFHWFRSQAVDRRGRERRAYLFGIAGRPQPGVNASIQVQVGYTFWK
jgi:lipid A 3-O-deacylase